MMEKEEDERSPSDFKPSRGLREREDIDQSPQTYHPPPADNNR